MNKRRGWSLLIVSTALYLAGLGVFIATDSAQDELEAALIVLIGILFMTTVVALAVTWFATQASGMNRITGGSFNTLLWTFLLFVPIANILSFYMFADHIRRTQTAVGVTGMSPVALFVSMVVSVLGFVGFIGAMVAQYQMDKIGAGYLVSQSVAQDWRPEGAALHSGTSPPPFYAGNLQQALAPPRPAPWQPDWPRLTMNAGVGKTPPFVAEVVPMPGAAILMLFLAIASIPTAMTGPAGVLAGAIALAARNRLVRMERRTPGHRGARAAGWAGMLAGAGLVAGSVMTVLILAISLGLL